MTINFKPISSLKRKQIFKMLLSSYRDLINSYDVKNRDKYIEGWQQSDKNAFDNPETIGKCILVSFLDNKLVGFASWDPRHFPEYGIIGQNCILPEHQEKGHGKNQIKELLRIFKEAKCKKALVSTGDNDFFIPAQKMYKSLGFKEIGRHVDKKWGYLVIDYEKLLD